MFSSRHNISSRRSKHLRALLTVLSVAFMACFLHSCGTDALVSPQNTVTFAPNLSEYGIYQGSASALQPTERFVAYSLPSALFTDYAEKQRLIRVPDGKQLTVVSDELPDFPDGTMLVKTFFYFHDKRDTAKGKRILETRLLVKNGEQWSVAVYRWNDAQTDATLHTSGFDTNVDWIDASGVGRTTAYHIPNNRECATCHQANGTILPIGPKMRNLNLSHARNGAVVSQLQHFRQRGVIGNIELLRIGSVPRTDDHSVSLQERSRAYLDINCAHCHSTTGYAADQGLDFRYATPLGETGIAASKNDILARMQSGSMPLLGTNLADRDGIALLTAYFNTLP
ncbi:MAG: hypothetical protein MUF71_19375 [Candidatus Kapabacteria bacterium]|jgi:uncharacterized repeat protein (TIGR03806 family)|nr:hypothetical protein [Candidatus Kapabacteria bacterium]